MKIIKKFSILIFAILIAILTLPACAIGEEPKSPTYVKVEKVEEKTLFEFKDFDVEDSEEHSGVDFMNYVMEQTYKSVEGFSSKSMDESVDPVLYNIKGFDSGVYGTKYTIDYKKIGWVFSEDFQFLTAVKEGTLASSQAGKIGTSCTGAGTCQSPEHKTLYLFSEWTVDSISFYIFAEGGFDCQLTTDLDPCNNFYLMFNGKISQKTVTYEWVEV